MLRRDIAHDLLTLSANLPGDEHGLTGAGLASAALTFLGERGRDLNSLWHCGAQIEAALKYQRYLSAEAVARLDYARGTLVRHVCEHAIVAERELTPKELADTSYLLVAIKRLSKSEVLSVLRDISMRERGDESRAYPENMRRIAGRIREDDTFEEPTIRDNFAGLFEVAADEADAKRAAIARGERPFGTMALSLTFLALSDSFAIFQGRDGDLVIAVEDLTLQAKLASIAGGTELDIQVDLYRTHLGGKREVLSHATARSPAPATSPA